VFILTGTESEKETSFRVCLTRGSCTCEYLWALRCGSYGNEN